MEEHPKIDYEGKELFEVGCRKCGESNGWRLFTDKDCYVVKCGCGHTIEVKTTNIQKEPDVKVIPLHFVV